jgi:hypothetical protein
MKIVRTTIYERSLRRLAASEADMERLERDVALNPSKGDVIPGLRGVRKLRFAFGTKGKSGGGRAIYYVVWADDTVFMLLAYAKSRQANLTQAQREAILALVEELDR